MKFYPHSPSITPDFLKSKGFEEVRSMKVNRIWSWKRFSFQATVSTQNTYTTEYRKGLISFTFSNATGDATQVRFGEDFITNAEHFTEDMVEKLWYGLHGKEIDEYVSF